MLGDKEICPVLSVKDLKAAQKFYEGTLGLKQVPTDEPGGVSYKTGNVNLFVYESQFAGTNKATALNWNVGPDLEKIMQALREKGVKFEHYDLPGLTRQGDVHVMGPMKTAWFKDPDGNILNISNR